LGEHLGGHVKTKNMAVAPHLVFIANNVILSEVEGSKAAFNKDISLCSI
jgi:hypothetical protein